MWIRGARGGWSQSNNANSAIGDDDILSLNGKLRDECLDMEWFTSLQEAKNIIGAWGDDYNWIRPHSVLGQLPPEVWVQSQTKQPEALHFQLI